jgi:hypothetical protein
VLLALPRCMSSNSFTATRPCPRKIPTFFRMSVCRYIDFAPSTNPELKLA